MIGRPWLANVDCNDGTIYMGETLKRSKKHVPGVSSAFNHACAASLFAKLLWRACDQPFTARSHFDDLGDKYVEHTV